MGYLELDLLIFFPSQNNLVRRTGALELDATYLYGFGKIN